MLERLQRVPPCYLYLFYLLTNLSLTWKQNFAPSLVVEVMDIPHIKAVLLAPGDHWPFIKQLFRNIALFIQKRHPDPAWHALWTSLYEDAMERVDLDPRAQPLAIRHALLFILKSTYTLRDQVSNEKIRAWGQRSSLNDERSLWKQKLDAQILSLEKTKAFLPLFGSAHRLMPPMAVVALGGRSGLSGARPGALRRAYGPFAPLDQRL